MSGIGIEAERLIAGTSISPSSSSIPPMSEVRSLSFERCHAKYSEYE